MKTSREAPRWHLQLVLTPAAGHGMTPSSGRSGDGGGIEGLQWCTIVRSSALVGPVGARYLGNTPDFHGPGA